MLERLEKRLPFLTRGARDLPSRQQTLHRAIAWSYDLLEEEEKALFGRLSVFAGGCTLEAAEKVCNTSGDLGIEVLDGLESLVEKSLLRQEEVDGKSRFSMLETIREYALRRLKESGEEETVRESHVSFFLALAEKAESKAHGPEEVNWLDKLEVEHNNVRSVLEWSLREGRLEAVARIAGALWEFWLYRANLTEGRGWLERALSATTGLSASIQARLLCATGRFLRIQGRIDQALVLIEESLTLRREVKDIEVIAESLYQKAIMMNIQGNYDGAKSLFEESLQEYREIGNKWGAAMALGNLSDMVWGNRNRRRELIDESLSLAREIGDKRVIGRCFRRLAVLALQQGEYERANAFAEENLTLMRERKSKIDIGTALAFLGFVAQSQGDYERADHLYRKSLALNREIGHKIFTVNSLVRLGDLAQIQEGYKKAEAYFEEARALSVEGSDANLLCRLGYVASSQGHHKKGKTLLTEALALFRERGHKWGMANCLDAIAFIAVAQDQMEQATRLLGAVDYLQGTIDVKKIAYTSVPELLQSVKVFWMPSFVQSEYDQNVTAAREKLGEDRFAKLWAEGCAMSLEDAIKYALEEEESV